MAGAARFVRGEVLHKHRMANLPAEVAAATSVDEDAIRTNPSKEIHGQRRGKKGRWRGVGTRDGTRDGTRVDRNAAARCRGGLANADASPRQRPQPHSAPQPRNRNRRRCPRWRLRRRLNRNLARRRRPCRHLRTRHQRPSGGPCTCRWNRSCRRPRPRRRGESENMLFILKYSRRGGASGAQLERARAPLRPDAPAMTTVVSTFCTFHAPCLPGASARWPFVAPPTGRGVVFCSPPRSRV